MSSTSKWWACGHRGYVQIRIGPKRPRVVRTFLTPKPWYDYESPTKSLNISFTGGKIVKNLDRRIPKVGVGDVRELALSAVKKLGL